MYTLVGVHLDMGLENKDNIQRLKKLNKSLHVLLQISTTCNHTFEPPNKCFNLKHYYLRNDEILLNLGIKCTYHNI